MRLPPPALSRRARLSSAVPGRPPAWQRRWLRHRRLVAALIAAAVVWSLGTTLHPPAPATVRVLLARHDLVPGPPLGPDDVEIGAIPAQGAPSDAATSLDTVLGRGLVAVVRAGEALRQRDVVAAPLLGALGRGLVATPVRLADSSSTALVRTGDIIDVIGATAGDATGDASAVVVASRVRVLAVPTTISSGGILGSTDTSSAPSGSGSVIVLATTSAQALDLARAAVGSHLSLVLLAG